MARTPNIGHPPRARKPSPAIPGKKNRTLLARSPPHEICDAAGNRRAIPVYSCPPYEGPRRNGRIKGEPANGEVEPSGPRTATSSNDPFLEQFFARLPAKLHTSFTDRQLAALKSVFGEATKQVTASISA